MSRDNKAQAERLRDAAWDVVEASSDYAFFRAMDAAVIAAGGESVINPHGGRMPALYRPMTLDEFYSPTPRRKRGLSQADYASQALTEKGEPLPIGRLLESTLKLGATIGGDQLANLRAALSKDKRFESITRNNMYFWWLVDRPLPAGWETGVESNLAKESTPALSDKKGGDGDATNNTH